jgi:hypothetical protein
MYSTIYIEEQIAKHPRTREICARFPQAARPAAHLELRTKSTQIRNLLKHVPEAVLFPCKMAA